MLSRQNLAHGKKVKSSLEAAHSEAVAKQMSRAYNVVTEVYPA
jgi:hypothetical protein